LAGFLLALLVSVAWGENARWLMRVMAWLALVGLVAGCLGLIASIIFGADRYIIHHHPYNPLFILIPVVACFIIAISFDYLGTEGD